jgi:hypothetical protein
MADQGSHVGADGRPVRPQQAGNRTFHSSGATAAGRRMLMLGQVDVGGSTGDALRRLCEAACKG